MTDEIKEILENIKCPQFGSVKYGKWGSLPLKVRIALKRLCEYANACDDYITTLQKENKHLNLQLDQALKDYDELQQKIDKAIEYINKNKKTLTKQTVDFYNNDELAKGKLKIGTFMWHVDELLDILQGDDKK